MNMIRALPRAVCLLIVLITLVTICIILVLTTARHDYSFRCLTLSYEDGSRWVIDARSGQSAPVPTIIAPLDLVFELPSPNGKHSMFVIRASSTTNPPYPNTQLAQVSIGTRMNPHAIPLEDIYVELGDGGSIQASWFPGTWTPDGKLLYIWLSQNGNFFMSRVDSDGTNKETYPLVEFQRFMLYDSRAIWSADGAYFATATVRPENNLVNIWSASDLHPVASFVADRGAFSAAWSHNGHRLFYAADSKVFPFVIALPDTQSAILIPYSQDFELYLSHITWSPDDNWILVDSQDSWRPSLEYRADGTLQQVLTGYILDADFDQQRFIVQDWLGSGAIRSWNVVYAKTGIIEQVAKDIASVQPDPQNAHRYAIIRVRPQSEWQEEQEEVDVMDEDGQNRKAIFVIRGSVGLWPERSMEWSPNGRTILVSWHDDFRRYLTLLNRDGTLLKEFVNAGDWQWLQNGQILAFVDYQNTPISIKTYDIESGEERTIVDRMQRVILDDIDPQTDGLFGFYWRASDGRTGVDVYDVVGQRVYRVLTPDVGDYGLLSVLGAGHQKTLFQSPDGQFVFAYNSQSGLAFVYANNRIVSVPSTDPPPKVRWSHCNPYDDGDGRMPK